MLALPVLNPRRRWEATRSILLRLYRLAVVAAIVWLVHRHAARLRIDGDAPVRVEEVKPFFPDAAKLATDESDRQGLFVLDAAGNRVGYALRTSPAADRITGYSGPTDTLVALDTDSRVVGLRVRSSWDTRQHVKNVAEDEYFMKLWNGKKWDEVAGMDPKAVGIEGVSGASLTSMAIANGIHYRFQQATVAALPKPKFTAKDWGVVAAIIGAIAMSFTKLRSHPRLRRLFQIGLVVYVGFYNGQLLSIALFNGWAAGGVPWRIAPGLALLGAAALATPWTTRRALYCSQICPHGVLQEWAGRAGRRWPRFGEVGRRLDAPLRLLPVALVLLVLTVTLLVLPLDLAAIEPFDAYFIRSAGVATVAIAVGGVALALFVPMAYCKYGCPTGLVLSFVRSHGRADRLGRRDVAAAFLLLAAGALYALHPAFHQWITR